MDTTTAMQKVGNNCGNLVFQYAVSNLINEPVRVVGRDTPWNPEKIKDSCRVLVIPSANFLREGADFSVFVDFLERTELPLVFIGLGAQADNYDKDKFDFHPSVLRMIDLIRERSTMISVRGEFTARVLEKYGIDQIQITGCPSNFINPSPKFADMISEKLDRPMHSFITHADEPWPKHKIKSDVERRLVEWTRNGRAMMVQQSVPEMIKYLRQNNPFSVEEVSEKFEASLAKTLMPDSDIWAFRHFLFSKMRTYYSVDQWLEDSSRFDFSIGLRLHGNMAAWQAGTPALWITHDSRTQELSETMGLPSIKIGDFLETCHTIEDAWNRIDYDPNAYAARRLELRARVDQVFSAFDIKTVPAGEAAQ